MKRMILLFTTTLILLLALPVSAAQLSPAERASQKSQKPGSPSEEVISMTGTVTEIEKYGHARLDVTIEDFNAAGFSLGDIVTVTVGDFSGDMPYFNGYYVDHGEYMVRAYPGHTNIAICINYGKFADVCSVSEGDEVTITLKEKLAVGGMAGNIAEQLGDALNDPDGLDKVTEFFDMFLE